MGVKNIKHAKKTLFGKNRIIPNQLAKYRQKKRKRNKKHCQNLNLENLVNGQAIPWRNLLANMDGTKAGIY